MTTDNEHAFDTRATVSMACNDDIEKKLRESEERYRSLTTVLAQIVWTTDSSGYVSGDMAMWCAYTGQRAEDMNGALVMQAIHPDDREHVAYAWGQAVTTKRTYETEYRLRRYDGVYRFFAVRGVPVLEADGSVHEWVGICSDIHERKLLEDHLRESNRRMEEFLGIASHELRTPLTTIKANIQLALRRLRSLSGQADSTIEKTNAIQDMLERAERQIGVLNRLVGDMIDISRIQSGKLQVHVRHEPANLVAIVQEIIKEQRKAIPGRSILLEMPVVEMIPVLADPDRLGQALTNYISNALKYSDAREAVQVQLKIEDGSVRVLVSDKGPGLSNEERQHVWECFYQAPGIKVLSGSGVGLGLGLYISQIIIDYHHGQVGVQSTPGEGSTFWFSLPILSSAETTMEKEE